MGRKLLGLVVVFVMLAAAPGLAQTKGGIRGTAVDNDGNPMPGVIVEASGEVLGGANRGTVTAANGVFNFGIMPPGRYRLTASMNGVAPVTFIMVPEAFAGEIKVTSERPLVDTSTATVGAAYDYDFVKDLPTRGNFYDVINNSAGRTRRASTASPHSAPTSSRAHGTSTAST